MTAGIPPKNESARGSRPWRFPDVLEVNWIIIARQLSDGAAGFPASCTLVCCRRRRSSSFLASRVLRLSPFRVLRSPQVPAPVIASRCIFGLPRLLHLPASPAVNLRVAPDLRSACAAFRSISRFPWLPHLPALPAGFIRVAPRISPSGVAAYASPGFPGSCICGWADDEPA